jgi:hypothetical protein
MSSFHDAQVPERTTMQGVQDPKAGLIHEETDVDLGGILKWFGALTLTVMVTFLVVWGIWEWWPERHEQTATLPSAVLGMPQRPPLPHLLPDPEFNASKDSVSEPQLEPKDQYQRDKRAEDVILRQKGLQSTDGLAHLPENAVSSVADQGTPATGTSAATGLEDNMPSMPSGGTVEENRLR